MIILDKRIPRVLFKEKTVPASPALSGDHFQAEEWIFVKTPREPRAKALLLMDNFESHQTRKIPEVNSALRRQAGKGHHLRRAQLLPFRIDVVYRGLPMGHGHIFAILCPPSPLVRRLRGASGPLTRTR